MIVPMLNQTASVWSHAHFSIKSLKCHYCKLTFKKFKPSRNNREETICQLVSCMASITVYFLILVKVWKRGRFYVYFMAGNLLIYPVTFLIWFSQTKMSSIYLQKITVIVFAHGFFIVTEEEAISTF